MSDIVILFVLNKGIDRFENSSEGMWVCKFDRRSVRFSDDLHLSTFWIFLVLAPPPHCTYVLVWHLCRVRSSVNKCFNVK